MEGGGVELEQPHGVSEPASWLRPTGAKESITELAKTKLVGWLAML